MRKAASAAFILWNCLFVFALGLPWPFDAVRRLQAIVHHYGEWTGVVQRWGMFARSWSTVTAKPKFGDYSLSAQIFFEGADRVDWTMPGCSMEGSHWERFRQYKSCRWVWQTLTKSVLQQKDEPGRGAAILIARQAKAGLGKTPRAVLLFAHRQSSAPANPADPFPTELRYQIDFRPGEIE